MEQNEKGIAINNALNYLTNEQLMSNYKSQNEKTQLNLTAFVCDECALPLQIYGANFIESYTNGKANILRCLCDLHAAELEVAE